MRRQLIQAGTDIASAAYDSTEPIEDLIGKAEKIFSMFLIKQLKPTTLNSKTCSSMHTIVLKNCIAIKAPYVASKLASAILTRRLPAFKKVI